MDTISAALIATVSAGLKDVGAKACGKIYQSIKDLIKKKLGEDNRVTESIHDLEKNPESKGRQMVLAENMTNEKVNNDPEIIKAAKELAQELKKTSQGRQAMGKYQIEVNNSQIGLIGEMAHIEGGMHFGDSQK
ncbi:MAG: hypothetical protein GY874_00290 [Desulfobacteraceae bacterium]|nr:hypothetical protein [Desulfobacteraceae bacterium]